jgi:long-chain acyl-CoA synthetase
MAGRPERRRWWLSGPALCVRRAFQALIGLPFTRYLARPLTVTGLENLAGMTGPMIIAPNHQSDLDTAVLYAALPARLRNRVVAAAARDVVFKYRILGEAARLLYGAFPMERRGSALTSLRTCLDLLSEEWSLLLFPEGRLSPDGDLGPFRSGLGLVAKEAGVPVLLVRMKGVREILPPGQRRPRRGAVQVHFDAPVSFSGDSPEAFVQALRERMLELQDDGRGAGGAQGLP